MFLIQKTYHTSTNDIFNSKQLIISLITFLCVLYEYFVVTQLGTTPSWGSLETIHLLWLRTTTIQVFFLCSLLGSVLLVLSSFRFIDYSNNTFLNTKFAQFMGIIFLFLGIISYFHFIVFEPFVLLYLSFIAQLYYYLVTITYSPFYQNNVNLNQIIQNTFWNSATKNFVSEFFANQKMDIILLALILLLIIHVILLVANTDELLPIRKNSFLKKFIDKEILLDQTQQRDSFKILGLFMLFQCGIALLYIFDTNLYLSCFLLLVLIPFLEKKSISTELMKLKGFPIKIYDVYIVDFLVVSVISFLFSKYQIDQLLYVLLAWVIITLYKLTKIVRNPFYYQKGPVQYSKVTWHKLIQLGYMISIILYITAWLRSYDEGLTLVLLLLATIVRYNSFFSTKIFQLDFLQFLGKKITIFCSIIMLIACTVFFITSIATNWLTNYAFPFCSLNGGCRPFLNRVQQVIGLHNPLYIQFYNWLSFFLMGNFWLDVSSDILNVLPVIMYTAEITILPFTLTFVLLFLLKKHEFHHKSRIIDGIIDKSSYIANSTPIFISSLVLLIIIDYLHLFRILNIGIADLSFLNKYYYYGLFIHGINTNFSLIIGNINFFTLSLPSIQISSFIKWAKYNWLFSMIVPTVVLVIFTLTSFNKLYNKSTTRILNSGYILSARASGFDESYLLKKPVLKNSLLDILNKTKGILVIIISVDPLLEDILSWPGLGYYSLQAFSLFNVPTMLSGIVFFSGLLFFGFLIIDSINYIVNPLEKDQITYYNEVKSSRSALNSTFTFETD